MVRFTCQNGWCKRSNIVLTNLPDKIIQRCFNTQTCPLCYGTQSVDAATALRLRRPRQVSLCSIRPRAGVSKTAIKRFKRTHPHLQVYLHTYARRPTQTHAVKMRITTSGRSERACRGGEDLSDNDGDGDNDGEAAADHGDIADDDDDNGGGVLDDVEDVAGPVLMDEDDDDDEDGADVELIKQLKGGAVTDLDPDLEAEADADEQEANSKTKEKAKPEPEDEEECGIADRAPSSWQGLCVVCGEGIVYPLCKLCARAVRKRTTAVLKI
jgi:hypothetical protein